MFTRRVILLFVLFVLGFVGLAARLAVFQLAQADDWTKQATRFVERHYLIDTRRGTILDAKGRAVARDEPADDVVMDFQAMSLDDGWITALARKRMTAAGLTRREDRLAALAGVKEEIAAQIEAVPGKIVALYDQARKEPGGEKTVGPLTTGDIEARQNIARMRIHLLKLDKWLRTYDKNAAVDEGDAEGKEEEVVAAPVAEEMAAHTIVEDVPEAVKIALHKMEDELPGVKVVEARRRKYFYGDVAAQVIGTTQAVDEKTWKGATFARPDLLSGEEGNLAGYLPGDNMGSFGLEAACENILRGVRGVGLRELGGADIADKHVDARPGRDVQMTIDMELQKGIQQRLYADDHKLLKGQEVDDSSDHNVAIVVMRISDRAIMAMVSTPTFDLNDYQKNIGILNKDEAHKPLLNRAIRNIYAPGSTVKPLVAAAALTEGKLLSPETTVLCKGYLYQPGALKCDGVHGNIALREAIERSCNVFFYTQGRELGLDKITDWYERFGFGSITGVGISELSGNVPDVASYHNEDVMRSEATQLGIGQGKLNVTPLQMANAYATLLENGIMRSPKLLAGQANEARKVFEIAPEHFRAIRDGMELVVHGESGTARSKMLGMSLPIAGKTGTAETELRQMYDEEGNKMYAMETDAEGKPVLGEDGKPVPMMKRDADGKLILDKSGKAQPMLDRRGGWDSWFVGYAPFNEPEYVVVAVKEFGGHGGITAVPVVRAAFVELEKQGYLPGTDTK